MDTNQMLRTFMQNVQQIKVPYTNAIQSGARLSSKQMELYAQVQGVQRFVAQLALVYQDMTVNPDIVTVRGEAVERALADAGDSGAIRPEVAEALLNEMLVLLANRGVKYED